MPRVQINQHIWLKMTRGIFHLENCESIPLYQFAVLLCSLAIPSIRLIVLFEPEYRKVFHTRCSVIFWCCNYLKSEVIMHYSVTLTFLSRNCLNKWNWHKSWGEISIVSAVITGLCLKQLNFCQNIYTSHFKIYSRSIHFLFTVIVHISN